MVINTDNLVSITEANQNFSRVARLVDENGAAVILKNNTPRYVLIEFSQLEANSRLPTKMSWRFPDALWPRIRKPMRCWPNEAADKTAGSAAS